MPPARKVSSQQEDAIVASVLTSSARWDSSPLKLPGFWAELQRTIKRTRAAYDALIKYGYVSSRATVCTCNAFHSLALSTGVYGPYTYDDPSPLVYIPPAAATTASAPAAAAAAPSAATAGAPAPAATVPASVSSSRYVVAPEAI